MKIKPILTTVLIITFGIFFTINFKKQMNKIENNYETFDHDPLKARVYTLENGLKVYLSSYKDAPRLQTAIAVRAGSKNDPSDATGLAHYLEHMLFKGTDVYGTTNYEAEKPLLNEIENLYEEYRLIDMNNIEKRELTWNKIDSVSAEAAKYAIANEYDKMATGIGAKGTNAYTSAEKTVYINDIPSNQIENWLKLESERFRNPVFRLFHTELEAVYEEKNISLDNDGSKMFQSLMDGIFPKHQYGQQTTIGTIEHLKNPSLTEIRKYFNKYYVPNNMAICLSGDFDYDRTIRMIDKYWGVFEAKEDPYFEKIDEKPIMNPIEKEVYGPEAERLYLGFRFDGADSQDAKMLSIIDMILSNSTAGLIDLNLNQEQKIIGGGCFPYILKDYSIHGFYGSPRNGQTLEEVKDLLLQQLEEVKDGNFPDWLMDAIISDYKLNQIKKYETNNGRVNEFIEAFILDIPWSKYQNEISELEKITKEDVINFANERYSNNYVVVYKRLGEDENVIKVKKPKITPISVNREDQSEFLSDLLSEKVNEIEPEYLNFSKDVLKSKINDVDLIYLQNKENQRFQIQYILDLGKDHNNMLPLAIDYFKFLGTDSITPNEKQQEFYRLGCSLNVSCSADKTIITLNGLSDNFDKSVVLLEDILNNAVADEEALVNLKSNTLKSRADAKLDKRTILWRAMSSYAKYGSNSSFTNIMSKNQLDSVKSSDLIKLIHNLCNYEHRILYYGPEKINDVVNVLNAIHLKNENLMPIPQKTFFEENLMQEPIVYVLDYDMKQTEVLMLSKGEKLNMENYPIIKLHNEYFGGGMSSIVFQEMRESKALAYSVYSAYRIPSKKEDSHYAMSYIGTQADKLSEAIKGMSNLLDTMPESESNLNNAKDAIVQKIRTERITKTNILDQYEKSKQMGIDYDPRKDLFEKVNDFSMNNIIEFHNEYMAKNNRVLLVLGSKDEIDLNILRKYGEIKQLSLEQVFGY